MSEMVIIDGVEVFTPITPIPNKTEERRETLNEIIARLAEQVQQPNSYPPCLFEPLVAALARRTREFDKYFHRHTQLPK